MEKTNFIVHFTKTSWGYSTYLMDKEGCSFGRMYIYDDDNTTGYISEISVVEDMRGNGYGNSVLSFAEYMCDIDGVEKIMLAVEYGSLAYNWYRRHGYIEYSEHEDADLVWMVKYI